MALECQDLASVMLEVTQEVLECQDWASDMLEELFPLAEDLVHREQMLVQARYQVVEDLDWEDSGHLDSVLQGQVLMQAQVHCQAEKDLGASVTEDMGESGEDLEPQDQVQMQAQVHCQAEEDSGEDWALQDQVRMQAQAHYQAAVLSDSVV